MQAALGWGSIWGGGTACSIRIPARSGLGGRLGGPAGEPRDFSPSSKLGSDVLAKIGNERRSDWQGRRQLRVSVLPRVIWQSGEVIRGEVTPPLPQLRLAWGWEMHPGDNGSRRASACFFRLLQTRRLHAGHRRGHATQSRAW